MTYIRPATIAADLGDKLSVITTNLSGYMNVQSLEIQRLIAEAKKLIKVDAAEGHCALGRIYHLCGDVEAMRHHMDNAYRLKSDIEFFGVRSACESNLGFMTETKRYFAKVGEPTRGCLSKSFDLGLGCGAVSLLNDYINRAEIMGLELSPVDVDLVRRIGNVFMNAGITDDYVSGMLDIAGEIMRERNIVFSGSSGTNIVLEDGSYPCVFYNLPINLSGDQVAEMSEELADRIAHSPLPIFDQLCVAFVPR